MPLRVARRRDKCSAGWCSLRPKSNLASAVCKAAPAPPAAGAAGMLQSVRGLGFVLQEPSVDLYC